MSLNWNFQGGFKTKNPLWEEYGYFMETHNEHPCHFMWELSPTGEVFNIVFSLEPYPMTHFTCNGVR